MIDLFLGGHYLSTIKSVGNVPADNTGNIPLFISANNLLTGTADFSGSNWTNSPTKSTFSVDSSKISSKLDPNGNKTLFQHWNWKGYSQMVHLYKDDIVTFGAYVYSKIKADSYLDVYVNSLNQGNQPTTLNRAINNIPKANIDDPLFNLQKGQTLEWSWVNNTIKINREDDYYIRFETSYTNETYIGSMIITKSNACSSWMPSTQDLARKSDLDDLKQQINQLKLKLGG